MAVANENEVASRAEEEPVVKEPVARELVVKERRANERRGIIEGLLTEEVVKSHKDESTPPPVVRKSACAHLARLYACARLTVSRCYACRSKHAEQKRHA